ncbi:unnamed protein product [Hanseniaspora opuntiae]
MIGLRRLNNISSRRSISCSRFLLQNKSSTTSTPAFTWVDFFAVKKQERRVNVISGVLTGFISSNIAFAYAANVEIDPTQTIFGVDPSIVIVGGCMTAGILGYLIGPAFGRPFFKFVNRKVLKQYNEKTKIFLEHVKKYRVDASSQSLNNPPPDYYGEKIGSLKEYKTWLRDSNAYRFNNGDL